MGASALPSHEAAAYNALRKAFGCDPRDFDNLVAVGACGAHARVVHSAKDTGKLRINTSPQPSLPKKLTTQPSPIN